MTAEPCCRRGLRCNCMRLSAHWRARRSHGVRGHNGPRRLQGGRRCRGKSLSLRSGPGGGGHSHGHDLSVPILGEGQMSGRNDWTSSSHDSAPLLSTQLATSAHRWGHEAKERERPMSCGNRSATCPCRERHSNEPHCTSSSELLMQGDGISSLGVARRDSAEKHTHTHHNNRWRRMVDKLPP